MNLNSIQLGGIKFEGKYSQANGKMYTIIDVPKEFDEDKLESILELMRLKELPAKVSYLDAV